MSRLRQVVLFGGVALVCGIAGFLFYYYQSRVERPADPVEAGRQVRCFGEIRRGPQWLEMVHPEVQVIEHAAGGVGEQDGAFAEGAQAGEQLAEGGRLGLGGEWRQERIRRFLGVMGPQAGQITVFLYVLLEDVDQLEIEREGARRGNRLRQIHVADQLHDRRRSGLGCGIRSATVDTGAELLHAQQPLGLLRRAFAAQHRLPQLLHQLETLTEQAHHPGFRRGHGGFDGGEGGPHGDGRGNGAIHDHPKTRG